MVIFMISVLASAPMYLVDFGQQWQDQFIFHCLFGHFMGFVDIKENRQYY